MYLTSKDTALTVAELAEVLAGLIEKGQGDLPIQVVYNTRDPNTGLRRAILNEAGEDTWGIEPGAPYLLLAHR